MKRTFIITLSLLMAVVTTSAQLLFSDYSDPDVCMGKDGGYWLTASSFQCTPGLPILYSDDLVCLQYRWEVICLVANAFQGTPGKVDRS